jgi:hypothetical protein
VRLHSIMAVALAVALFAACTAAPPATPSPATTDTPATATPTPATPATPATATPEPVAPATPSPDGATPAPGGTLTGDECDGIPSFMDPGVEDFAFTRDEELEAMFPASIAGSPLSEVTSFRWVEFICLFAGQTGLEAAAAEIPGSFQLAGLTMATAEYDDDEDMLSIAALRMPGANIGSIVQMEILAQLAAGEELGDELRSATIGGKQVYVSESEGEMAYMYAAGDVLFILGDMTEADAATVLSALP